MKKAIIIIIIFSLYLPLCGQDKSKKEEEEKKTEAQKAPSLSKEDLKKLSDIATERRKHWPYIVKFIKKEYSEKALKEIPKLEEKLKFYIRKANEATTEKSKKAWTEKAKKTKTELEVAKLWPMYEQTYEYTRKAYDSKDSEKFSKGSEFIGKIKKRYKELTASSFPRPEVAFYKKYGAQINKTIKKKLGHE